MATAAQQREERVKAEEERECSAWDCGSPLYDSFEVASLCHLLDRHLMFLPVPSGSPGSVDDTGLAAARLVSADGKMLPVKDQERKLRKMRKHGKSRSAADGNEKVLKATLRGICSAFTSFWRKR